MFSKLKHPTFSFKDNVLRPTLDESHKRHQQKSHHPDWCKPPGVFSSPFGWIHYIQPKMLILYSNMDHCVWVNQYNIPIPFISSDCSSGEDIGQAFFWRTEYHLKKPEL